MHPKILPESGKRNQYYDIAFYTNYFIFKDYKNFFLCNAYYHDKSQIFPILMHQHSFYEINIITRGSGWHYIENQCIEAKLGSIFVISPNIKHGYYTDDADNFEVYHILLSSQFMDKFKDELECINGYKTMFEIEPIMRTNLKDAVFLILSDKELAHFKPDFDELANLSKKQDASSNVAVIGKSLYLISMFCTLLVAHHGNIIRKNDGNNDKQIDILSIIKAIEYIQNNYAEKITINELARLAKMSRSVFVKQFEHYTSSTVSNYIMNTRLEKAISLLNTNDSVAKIAQDCGFFDSSHFSRYFKQTIGCSPLEYRKKQNGNQSLYNKD